MMQDRRTDREPGVPGTGATHAGVSLHIERLVVDGLPLARGQVASFRTSVERELTRLLQREGLGFALHGGAVPGLVAPAIQISTPFRPADLGRQIARSVHESLTGPR